MCPCLSWYQLIKQLDFSATKWPQLFLYHSRVSIRQASYLWCHGKKKLKREIQFSYMQGSVSNIVWLPMSAMFIRVGNACNVSSGQNQDSSFILWLIEILWMVSISSSYKIYPLHHQIFRITQRVTEGRREEKKKKMLQTSFIFHQTASNLKFLTKNTQVEQIHSRFQALTELKLVVGVESEINRLTDNSIMEGLHCLKRQTWRCLCGI